jgi:hypothetical protein
VPEASSFDYAIIRVVPRVDREEFINVGVVLFCSKRDFLGATIALNEELLRAMAPSADVEVIRDHLAAIPRICAGGAGSGPIGKLTQKERFLWLTAPRSTIVQVSAVHSGMSDLPETALAALVKSMVSRAEQ